MIIIIIASITITISPFVKQKKNQERGPQQL